MITFFSPQCGKEIKEEDRICPYCVADITEHEKKCFEEKLIIVRKKAIEIINGRNYHFQTHSNK